MSTTTGERQVIYDPRGVVEAEPHALSPRVTSLAGLRLGVLDNTKWNGGKLLRAMVGVLVKEHQIGEVRYYQKESFSKNASPILIAQIAAENDLALVAIGD